MVKKVKIGIIGSGFGLYGLLPAFKSIKTCKVVSICGKNTKRLINVCQSIGLKNIYTDWKLMLENEQLDALAIAVTPNVQYEIAKEGIKKGLHIFAEKPLAATYTQAKELLDLATKKKVKHAIDFIFPEIDEWKKVKELLDKKVLGKLKQFYVNWDFLSYDIKNRQSTWKTNNALGGGALSFYFSHSLYYLEYYAGKISSLKSLLSYSKESLNGGEVGVDLLLKFKNTITGYAHLNCNVRGLNRQQLIFICQNGTIILQNENSITDNFIIKIYTDSKIKRLSIQKKQAERKDEDERIKVVRRIASRFIDACIQGGQVTPSFKDGVRVQELIEKIRAEQI